MFNVRMGRAGPILGLIFLFGIVAGIVIAKSQGLVLSGPVRWAVFLALLGPVVWLTLLYWRRIDEAAREAQKTAWYWGGSLGLGAGLVAVALFGDRDPTFGGLLRTDAAPIAYLHAGAVAVVVFQFTGFLLAWAIWWWSKR